MAHKYLIALDGSDHSKYSISWALENLVDSTIDSVLLLSVGVLSINSPCEFEYSAATRNILGGDREKLERQKAEENAKEIVNDGKLLIKNFFETRKEKEVPVKCFVKSDSDPANYIVNFSKEHKVDVLVMGHRGTSSPDGINVGTVTQHCLHSAGCTVVVTRKRDSLVKNAS